MVGPGMFDGMITGVVTLFIAVAIGAFVLGALLVLGLMWLWPYLPSVKVVW